MDSELAKLNVEEVCTLLQSNNFDSDVIAIFRRNKIPGNLMAKLEEAEMTDLGIEAWGDRRDLRKLILISSGKPAQKSGGSQAVARDRSANKVSQRAQDTTDSRELVRLTHRYRYTMAYQSL